ncbi:hypothetical protein [Arenimonas sp.]|uniref:hypothetical protein n=1 Tax=Arenimonas sp. TaxID=1872635 RepID=UPI0035AFA0A2
MSKVITFLETLGRSHLPGQLAPEQYEAAVDAAGIEDAARDALLARDADALGGLLGGRMEMMCLLFPAEGDENKDDEQEDSDSPDKDDGKQSASAHGIH